MKQVETVELKVSLTPTEVKQAIREKIIEKTGVSFELSEIQVLNIGSHRNCGSAVATHTSVPEGEVSL
jgi:hypothetical protein